MSAEQQDEECPENEQEERPFAQRLGVHVGKGADGFLTFGLQTQAV